MDRPVVHTLDLNFRGISGTIASYLIPHKDGVVLIECGPGSTISDLKEGIEGYGYRIEDVTDVLLTHIHLDHAGASGWLAKHGACIHVHPLGAPHMRDPEKLLQSAGRIYGDMMEPLWGKFLPVPEDQISVPEDEDHIKIGNLEFQAIDTPGHANHHYAYLWENICFCGDIGGVRMRGQQHISLPMPPPEFHLEKWRQSVKKLRQFKFSHIAPTHFDIYTDPEWHLNALEQALSELEKWMEKNMREDPPLEKLRTMITEWEHQRLVKNGLGAHHESAQQAANPTYMSADGIYRYWYKYRNKD